jgi:NSS family neurotransmitter:Na+ symporter
LRDQWNSKIGFIMAAIGSAVGLGNIWRFPYVAATNGGGAFLLPYFFVILTAGIPILILEYTMGKTYRGGAPSTWARINKRFEWLGWWQVMCAFVIATYYTAIVVWVVSYFGFAFTSAWGADPTSFFLNDFLGVTDSAHNFGGLRLNLVIPFLCVWAVSAFIIYRGINRGINLACKICLPILIFMIFILVIRGLTLPGAVDGLAYMFTPDWSALKEPRVWVAAYGQVFYSLSICFAIMVSYSSYLPKKTDVVNTAFITATANHGFEIFAGIGVFSIMGFMALQQGVGVSDVASAGVGLAFMTFPTAISTLPGFNAFFGICFFGALLTAGVTSQISILQAVTSGFQDKFNVSHAKACTIMIVPAFVISFLFITGAGLNILDIVDYFINSIGVASAGFLEIVLIGWFFQPEKLRREANEFSNFSIGKWWIYAIKIVSVFGLGIMVILNLKDTIINGYGSYSPLDISVFGWGVIALCVVATIVLTVMRGRENYDKIPEEPVRTEEKEAE